MREGSARENLVKADLLRRGFEVYAGDGPTSFDICAYKYDAFIRIEVKGIPPSGRFPTGPVNGYLRKPAEQFDVLATVQDTRIKYNVSVAASFGSTPFAQCITELTNNEGPSIYTTRKYLARRQQ
jgi:hypothetical protein